MGKDFDFNVDDWELEEWWKTATFTEIWRIIYVLQEKRDSAAYNGDLTTAKNIDNKKLSLIKKINEKQVLEDITTKNVSIVYQIVCILSRVVPKNTTHSVTVQPCPSQKGEI